MDVVRDLYHVLHSSCLEGAMQRECLRHTRAFSSPSLFISITFTSIKGPRFIPSPSFLYFLSFIRIRWVFVVNFQRLFDSKTFAPWTEWPSKIFFRIPGFRPSFPAPRIPHNIGLKSPAKDPWRGVYWFNPKQNPVNKSVEKEASGCCLVVGRLTDFDVLFRQSTGNALYLVMNNKVMRISYIYWKEKTLVMI